MALNLINYYNYINNIIAERGQWADEVRLSERTCERHHIILKCKGGEPQYLNWQHHQNIIWLYPAEHFEAHKILYLDNKDDIQIANSFILMSNTKGINLSADDYELMKQAASKVFKDIRKNNPGPRLGMKTSEETKHKMSLAQSGEKSHNYGKKWMTNGEAQKLISMEEISIYIENGWTFGMFGMTNEQRKKDSLAIKGRIHIHKNGCKSKMIHKVDLEQYLAAGWQLGRGKLKEQK